jgi:hypothetical protein
LYSFAPKYNRGAAYAGHFTQAGVQVLPVNEHGKQELNGWCFHYQGWMLNNFDKKTFVRNGATQQDLKPATNWRGSLDTDVLKKHGCTADWVRDDP